MFVFPRTIHFKIASYRRHLPDFISNKIRTCATAHQLKLIHGSSQGGKKCRKKDDKKHVGIAHLLEHVMIISALRFIRNVDIDGKTSNEWTTYTLRGRAESLFKELGSFSTHMFYSPSFDNEIIINERKRVDGEFYIGRTLMRSLQVIFNLEKLPVPPFGTGNLSTLDGTVENLERQLKGCHALYRKRPVFVCIYSKLPIDTIQKSFEENFWIFKNYDQYRENYNEEKPTTTKPSEPRDTSSKTNDPRRLFVVSSDADALQLQIFFPFNERLNIQERNLLKIIAKLLSYRSRPNLQDVFLDKKIGTRCRGSVVSWGFKVAVDVLDCKRENFEKAITGVFQFIKFLQDSWGHKQFQQLKKRDDNSSLESLRKKNCNLYAEFISKECDEIEREFSEQNLCKSVAECKDLITRVILENKDAVYSIVTQEPEQVINNLNVETSPIMETESVYQTQYCRTDLNLHMPKDNAFSVFGKEEKKNFCKNDRTARETVLINDPSDLAYQSLYVANMMIGTVQFRKTYKLLFPGHTAFYERVDPEKPVDAYATLQKFMEAKKFRGDSELRDSSNMDDEQFRLVKNYKMRILSQLLTDSKKLAKSLLTLAVQNTYCPVQIHPIIQYDNLRVIDKQRYIDHFKKVPKKDEIKKSEKADGKNGTTKDLIIPAINKNEHLTVTLNFFQAKTETDKSKFELMLCYVNVHRINWYFRNHYGIYHAPWYTFKVGSACGIVFETYTVEKTDNNEMVRTHIIEEMIKKFSEAVAPHEEYRIIWESMNINKYCIQIYGHKSSVVLKTPFENQFDKWFDKDKKTEFETFFQSVCRMPHKHLQR